MFPKWRFRASQTHSYAEVCSENKAKLIRSFTLNSGSTSSPNQRVVKLRLPSSMRSPDTMALSSSISSSICEKDQMPFPEIFFPK